MAGATSRVLCIDDGCLGTRLLFLCHVHFSTSRLLGALVHLLAKFIGLFNSGASLEELSHGASLVHCTMRGLEHSVGDYARLGHHVLTSCLHNHALTGL